MDKAEQIYNRMFRNRLKECYIDGWTTEDRCIARSKAKGFKERIENLLAEGKIVRAGYTITDIRNFHNHYILWRDRKK